MDGPDSTIFWCRGIEIKKTKNIKNKRKRYIVRYSVKGVREGRDMHAANMFPRLHTQQQRHISRLYGRTDRQADGHD